MESYKKRQFKALENWQVEKIIMKRYIMGEDIASINKDVINKAMRYIQQKLPTIIEGHDHNNAGYVIMHQGGQGIWLLIHCWAYEHIVLSTVAYAEPGNNDFVCYDDKHFLACVWEHVVINHERYAWVKNVMCKNSSVESYLENRLTDGEY